MILMPEEKEDDVTAYISSEILMGEEKLLSSVFLYHIKPHPTLLPGLAGNPVSKILWRSLSSGVVQESLGLWGTVLKSAYMPLSSAPCLDPSCAREAGDPRQHSHSLC